MDIKKQPAFIPPIDIEEFQRQKGIPRKRKKLPLHVIKSFHTAKPGEGSFRCERCKVLMSSKVMVIVQEHPIFDCEHMVCRFCKTKNDHIVPKDPRRHR